MKVISSILKLLLASLIIPALYGVSVSFLRELQTIDPDVGTSFLLGVLAYLGLHLLIFQPVAIYQKGQQFLQSVFGFSGPLASGISYLLPLYSIIILVLYLIAGFFWNVKLYLNLFLFFIGFFTSLNFILGAEDLKTKGEDSLKANYIIYLFVAWIFGLILAAAIFNLFRTGFYFSEFFKNAFNISSDLYIRIFKQLFNK